VIPSSAYIQRSPFEKQDLFSDYQFETQQNSFWQNSTTPSSYFQISTLGRSVLPEINISQDFATRFGIARPITPHLQHALWTAQVLAFWLTDGVAYRRYDAMEGLISRMGLDPKNPSVVLDQEGLAITDLRALLNPTNDKTNIFFVKGPDSLFGPELESVIEEYAGTRKLFGKDVPEISKPILESLIIQFPTAKIISANEKFLSGSPLAPRVETTETPCGMLLEDARLARKDCRGDSPKTPISTQDTRSQDPKNSPTIRFAQTDSNNSMLYLGLAGLVVAIGTASYLYSRKHKQKDI
jgi:hypothetical protein